MLRALKGNLVRFSMLSTSVAAMAAMTSPAAAQTLAREFDIPEQSLSSALLEFSKQSDVMVIVAPDVAAGKKSRSLRGGMPIKDAISHLLHGTGLNAVPNRRGGGYRIERAAAQKAPPPTAQKDVEKSSVAISDSGGDIVVTALKGVKQTAINTPAGIAIIPGEKIASYNASSLKDFLAQSPGVSIDVGIAGSQSIGIRGLNPSFGSASVGFYVDDLPFSFINVNLLPDLSPFDLHSIEVLRGPQSSLYGAGASGGVVKLRTNDPDLNDRSLIFEGYGTTTKQGGEGYSISSVVNVPLVKDRLAFRGSVSYQDLAGWIDDAYVVPGSDPDYGKDVNDQQKLTLRGKLLFQPTDRLSILALANYSRDDTGMVPLSDDSRLYPRSFDTDSSDKFEQYGVKASYVGDKVVVTNTTGIVKAQRDFTFPDYAAFRQLVSLKSVTNELTVGSADEGRLSWLTGIFYRHTKQAKDIDFSQIGLPFNLPDEAKARQLSFYGNASYAIIPDRLEVAVGGSYSFDRTNIVTTPALNVNGEALVAGGIPPQAFLPPVLAGPKVKSEIFSPKISVSVHPREGMTIYAVYSEGYRAGFNDNGFSTFFSKSAFGAVGGDPDMITGAVRPERVKAYEVGLKASLIDGLIYTELALFQNDLTNSQQSAVVADPVSGVTTNTAVNIGVARTRGVEALLNFNGPIPDTNISFTGTYVDAKVRGDALVGNIVVFREGDRLNGVPKLTLGANGNFRSEIGNRGMHLGGTVSVIHTTSRTISQLGIPPFAGDAITRVDARLEIESGPTTFYAFAHNILDDNGRISPSVRSSPAYSGSVQNMGVLIDGLLGSRPRPRTFGIGARLSF